MNILVIGAGNMGLTFSYGMATSPQLNKEKINVFDVDKEKIASLNKEPQFNAFENLEDCLPKADYVFIAVKPFHSDELFEKMKDLINNDQVFISLMAGVNIASIQTRLGVNKVVRTMPNLPAKVNKGVTAYTESAEISKNELIIIKALLDTTGVSLHVNSEKMIDASTGVSGSGPAYVFYFVQAMLEAAEKLGFQKDEAKLLVTNTFDGALELLKTHDFTTEEWIAMVSSKGGTTHAAINSMKAAGVNQSIQEGVFAAFNRAEEIGKEE
ncbi:pyrroline-5-carboxylate reductase [Flavicella marina]|uniref:pyrroline-5-carboxylate reductase n=1 Tax=Flavicella marina TaxID=1475951 RepID=UPI0012645DB7|nr:pyrroline-5-carboxylate reductase [Flavicella marina]